MKTFGFDVKFFASFNVQAKNETEARKLLARQLEDARIIASGANDGTAFTAIAVTDADGGLEGVMDSFDLMEVDGEPV